MCMEDINIERALRGNVYVATDAVPVNIRGNQDRLSIRLVCGLGIATTGNITTASSPINGGTTSQAIPLGAVGFAPAGVVGPGFDLVDDITLAKVGDLLKEELVLNATGGTVFAIETYLPVNDGQSLDIGKLPNGK